MKHFDKKIHIVLKYTLMLLLMTLLCFAIASCADTNEYAVISENNESVDGLYYTLYENNTVVVTGMVDPSKKTVTIPSKIGSYRVIGIGDAAFQGVEGLQYVIIEEGTTSIGRDAFRKCYNLLRIDIPKSVTSIGNYAFDSCEKLCEVVGLTGLTSFGKGSFYQCLSLTSIHIAPTVETIGDECFFGCASLVKVTLPKKIQSVFTRFFLLCMENHHDFNFLIACEIDSP